MEQNQTNTNPETEEENDSPWKTIGIGLLLLAGAVFLYYTFDKLETEGGRVKINWILALLYNVAGKWPVVSVVALIGAFTTYSGIKDFKNKK
jgi:nitrate reductase NapE component